MSLFLCLSSHWNAMVEKIVSLEKEVKKFVLVQFFLRYCSTILYKLRHDLNRRL